MLFVWVVTYVYQSEDLVYIFMLFGIITYFTVFDFGVGKPIYARLRKMYLSKDIRLKQEVLAGKSLMLIILIILLFFCTFTVTILYVSYLPIKISYLSTAALGLYIAFSICITLLKDVFDAIDKYLSWEKFDVYRKIGLLIATTSIYFDPSLLILSFTLLIINILILVALFKKMNSFGYYGFDIRGAWHKIPFYKESAFDNLIFKINEVLMYNWGYLIIPFFSDQLLVLYAILNRIFLGVSIPIRAISDIYIHNLTKIYFSKGFSSIEHKIIKLILISLILGLMMIFFIFYFHKELNFYWLNEKASIDLVFLYAISIFILTNTILHPIGSVLISIGGYFKKMRNYSFIVVTLMITISLILLILNKGEFVLLGASLAYSISLVFYIKSMLLLKVEKKV